MKVEYINPFLTSTISVFDTMLGCTLIRGTPYIKNSDRPEHEVSGVIGLSGKAQGTVVLGLSLSAEFSGPVPERIATDPTRLRQILMNLVANAIKFTELGGVRVVTRMLDPPESPNPRIGFEIVDTGIGMTISKQFAELLGGNISVSSEPGKGSRFLVVVETGPLDGVAMPRDCTEAQRPARAGRANKQPAEEPLDARLLLAEDGPDNQRLIAFVLKKAGAEVTVAENGQIALDEYFRAKDADQPFDCILMDMQMPVLDGYEATRRLREADCAVPIIALTAHAMQGDREKCLAAGCDDYATKPIDRVELLKLIARHIEDYSKTSAI